MTPEEFPDLASKIHALHYVSKQLHDASIGHIREILAPLAASLFGVRANLDGLLKKSRELETSFRNDSNGLGETVNRFSTQSNDIRKYTQDLDVSVKQFSTAGSEMEERLGAISEASRQINDVAERIKVLSINASIEAARAGKQGAGFKIISQEVRKLAEDTNLFASQIEETIASAIGETKDAFERFTRRSVAQADEMHVILGTTENLEVFVKGLFAMIDGIFREYDGFVLSLESELDHVSPTLQRNEIATQQIENTWRGLYENLKSLFPALTMEGAASGVAPAEFKTMLQTFARFLTTPLEAEVIQRIASASGVTGEVVAKASDSDITLF